MIHDAKVEVTCDQQHCYESLTIQPKYNYRSYSGHDGFYDTSDSAIKKQIEAAGWKVREGRHYCANCSREPKP